ncbi:ceramide synthase-like [Ruditapes philippinarum]|uniref:ceramide synthase-like n=1 Tax=Ruditapes philippinarum TaxID=129788 RepID=UPI00295B1291|nr:ceramide synthase-like [Ruditapes philippinarum]
MGVITLISGGIFFISLNALVRNCLKHVFNSKLSVTDQYFITEKCVNAIQAILATVVGVIIAKSCQENIMTDVHWLTNTYAWFGLSYFLYDIWAMYNTHFYLNLDIMLKMNNKERISHFVKFNKAMLVHHVILPFIFFPSILYFRNNKGDYFVGVLYTCEAAIPFIAVRFILSQLKIKDNIIYIIAGLLMIVVFFLVRVCIFPYLYMSYARYADIPFFQVPSSIPLKCNIGCLLILVLQLHFLYLMIRGAYREFYKMYERRIHKC